MEWNEERLLREKEKKSGDKTSQEEKRKCKAWSREGSWRAEIFTGSDFLQIK